MKASLIIILSALLLPVLAMAQESLQTDRLQATFQDNGNWELTDLETGVTWQSKWITSTLMKVTGTDNSCFVIGQDEAGMVQLNCRDLTQISILLAYQTAS